ncbi:class I SAM-dependent methyltransferase [Pseudomonas sp.]|uniref:class I SAM-dependent methyltransferase n=1 Tax=Pseudomonas sp. TaxID=306 RepID=UPI003C420A44
MTAKSKFGVPMNSGEYAKEWQVNSAGFESHGDYKWMATQLGNADTVLEIGCGSGNGTLELAKQGRRFVVIEPNAELAQMALNTLRNANISVDYVAASALHTTLPTGNVIIDADIFDKSLDRLLASTQFDAIVCWLIGAEPERVASNLNVAFDEFQGGEPTLYRERLHARCGELGALCLKPRGLIHVVDRQGVSHMDDCKPFIPIIVENHSKVFGPRYSVSSQSISFRELSTSLAADSRMQYSSNQTVTAKGILIFVSVKAVLS